MVLGRCSLLDRVEVAHRAGDEAREPAARLGPLERIDVVLEAHLSSIHPSAALSSELGINKVEASRLKGFSRRGQPQK